MSSEPDIFGSHEIEYKYNQVHTPFPWIKSFGSSKHKIHHITIFHYLSFPFEILEFCTLLNFSFLWIILKSPLNNLKMPLENTKMTLLFFLLKITKMTLKNTKMAQQFFPLKNAKMPLKDTKMPLNNSKMPLKNTKSSK